MDVAPSGNRTSVFVRASQNPTKSELLVEDVIEPPVWAESASALGQTGKKSRRTFNRVRGHDWIVGLLFLVCDILCWVVLYGIVSYIRRDEFFASPLEFVLVDCVVLAVILQALYIVGGYSRNTEMRGLIYTTEHILAIATAAAISAMLIYSAATFDQTMKPSRGMLLLSFMLFLPVSLLYRRSVRNYVVAKSASQTFLVIGSGIAASCFYEAYKNSPNGQQLDFVDLNDERVGQPIAGEGSPRVQGDLASKLNQLSERYSGIILAEKANSLSTQLLERLVRAQFHQTRVYTLESFYETHWRYVPLNIIDPVWPLQSGFQLARTSPYHYLKRLFDLIVSAITLVICAPLFALIALLIWIEEGRPIFFRQARIGRDEKPLVVLKFRTMRLGSTKESEDIYTREGDSRITRLGRWLRKLRLDELPQLWNVFKGDMSLIGPRAEWNKCAERYERTIPFYHFRHLVKPGITGWAQVNYPYGESDQDAVEKLKYDLYYIRHYSLKLDAMIVLKTVHTMLFGKGR
jgi:exopolysaccharide biosynthesis polyprenyl glycosylphosphotransferase